MLVFAVPFIDTRFRYGSTILMTVKSFITNKHGTYLNAFCLLITYVYISIS